MPFPRASKALTRFTVLDLTRVRAGPTCARQLADWGANVIKIEAPPGPEEPMGGPREGSDFQNLHRNKRSVTLNLKAPEGLAAFKRMVKKADVVVENFRPDVKKRLGIDYKALARINPRLVYASISGFGQDGPYADRPGFDQIAQGMGGLMSITGLPGNGPVRVGIPVADLSAGLFAALGILVALLEREKSGKGQQIATSLLQAQIFMLDFQAARYPGGRRSGAAGRQQSSDQHPDRRVQDPRRLHQHRRERPANVGAALPRARRRAAAAQARIPDRRSPLRQPRRAHRRHGKPSQEPQQRRMGRSPQPGRRAVRPDLLDRRSFCRSAGAAPRHGAERERERQRHKSKLRLVGQPVSLSRTPSRLAVRPPEAGEHTDAVLKEFGFSAREIAALHKAGAV